MSNVLGMKNPGWAALLLPLAFHAWNSLIRYSQYLSNCFSLGSGFGAAARGGAASRGGEARFRSDQPPLVMPKLPACALAARSAWPVTRRSAQLEPWA